MLGIGAIFSLLVWFIKSKWQRRIASEDRRHRDNEVKQHERDELLAQVTKAATDHQQWEEKIWEEHRRNVEELRKDIVDFRNIYNEGHTSLTSEIREAVSRINALDSDLGFLFGVLNQADEWRKRQRERA